MMRELPIILRSLIYLRPSMLYWRIHRMAKNKTLLLLHSLGLARLARPRCGHDRLLDLSPIPCLYHSETFDLESRRFQFLQDAATLSMNPLEWPVEVSKKPLLWQFHFGYHDYLLAWLGEHPHPEEALHQIHHFLRDYECAFPPEKVSSRAAAWHPYVLSIRIESWCRLAMEARRQLSEPFEFLDLLSQGSMRMTRVLLRNLEFGTMANHLLRNIKALIFAGCSLQGPLSDRAMNKGLSLLEREVREQILADGMHFERSPMYHVSVLNDLLDIADILLAANRTPSTALENGILAMTRWLRIALHPDGDIPWFNDSTSGFTLSAAEVLRRGEAFQRTEGDEELPELFAMPDCDPALWSGLMIYRSSQFHCVFDAGNIAVDYQPGHAHCDTLGLELSWKGHRVLTDTGVFHYRESTERTYSRSTAAHSTVSVDRLEQSEVWKSFRVGRRARILGAAVETRQGFVLLQAAHDGFRRLAGVIHERAVIIERDRWIVLVDILHGQGEHQMDSWLHFDPNVTVTEEGDLLRCGLDEREFLVKTHGPFQHDVLLTPCYPAFGIQRNRSTLHLSGGINPPTIFATTLTFEGPPPEIHLDLKATFVRISTENRWIELQPRNPRAHPVSLPVFSA